MKSKYTFRPQLILAFVLILVITACAEVVPIHPETVGDPAGFWKGLWHGIILIFSFIISLFKDDVAVYAANNTGGWYDFGYLLGIMIFFGGSGNRTGSKCC